MTPYILHISILVGCCYIFYKLFLEQETFFQLNRWVLLSCVLLAFVLPFVEIPQEWSLRQVDTNPSAVNFDIKPVQVYSQPVEKNRRIQRNDEIVQDSAAKHENREAVSAIPVIPEKQSRKMSYSEIMAYVYFVGLAVFVLNFLIQFFLLLYNMLTLPCGRGNRCRKSNWKNI